MIDVDDLQKCKQIDRGDFLEFWQDNKLLLCQFKDGWRMWFNKDTLGELHRDNGPAVIKPDGTEFWYQNGKIHRDNGPAIIRSTGDVEFWKNGKKL